MEQASQKKSGGSAIKRLKKTLKEASVYDKLGKVSKKASQASVQKQLVMRREAKSILHGIQKKALHNNPFEQRIGKEHHPVLNRVVKGARGRPGLIRAKHQEIRQNSLAVELKNRNRENIVIDKRFGENDPNMSVEDKMLERFMREKTKKVQNGAMYNLEEDDLTHMGQSLSGFDDAGLEAVGGEEDDSDGNIDASIVKYTHFGGFEPDANDKDPNARKSRNDIMKEVIAKSKMFKRERQAQKEEDLNLAEDVDKDLEEIRGLLAPMNEKIVPSSEGKMVVSADRLRLLNQENVAEEKKKVDDQDYDRFIRELAYERRAQASDRTKSEEEVAADAKKELEDAECARVRRMKGLPDTEEKVKRVKVSRKGQADDLGDEDYEEDLDGRLDDSEVIPLTYKNGVLVNKKIFMKEKEESGSDLEKSNSESESNSDSDSDLDSGLESDHESVEGSDDGFEVISDQEELEKMFSGDDESVGSKGDFEKGDTKKRSESMKLAQKELPFTFEFPADLDAFKALISGREDEDVMTILKRLRVLYNPKLSGENKEKMEILVKILVAHVIEVGKEPVLNMKLIQFYQTQYVDLARQFPIPFGKWFRGLISTLRDGLSKKLSSVSKSSFPSAGELMVFMDLSRIYSCSDLHHKVMTPTMLLLGQYLAQCPIISIQDAFSGILLCHTFYKYTQDSKRFVPEVINFLHFVLIKVLSKCKNFVAPKNISTLRPCKVDLAIRKFSNSCSPVEIGKLFSHQNESKVTDSIRLTLLHEAISLLIKFCKLYAESTSVIEVFEVTMPLLNLIPTTVNQRILDQMTQARRMVGPLMESAGMRRKPLELQKRKAIPIKTYVPKFEATYSIDKRYDPDRERAESGKLKAEYKREFKGAVRELRKDAAFLGRKKIESMKEADTVYKKKMDRIVGQLAEQEGAMRGYEKQQKKAKKKR